MYRRTKNNSNPTKRIKDHFKMLSNTLPTIPYNASFPVIDTMPFKIIKPTATTPNNINKYFPAPELSPLLVAL